MLTELTRPGVCDLCGFHFDAAWPWRDGVVCGECREEAVRSDRWLAITEHCLHAGDSACQAQHCFGCAGCALDGVTFPDAAAETCSRCGGGAGS